MSIWDKAEIFYEGQKHDLYILESCFIKVKKSGLKVKVLSRLRRICNTGHFGEPKIGFKYLKTKNIGWVKWKDGTRVYYSLFDNNKILLLTTSGNKNSQDKDIKRAQEILDEIKKEIKISKR